MDARMGLGRAARRLTRGFAPVGFSILLVAMSAGVARASGGLDKSFGHDGKVTTNVTKGSDGAKAVAIQGDGKIVVAGSGSGHGVVFAVARYRSNGTLDPTFGGDGTVTTDFNKGFDGAEAVAIQSDGKIVAAGTSDLNCSCARFALARYDASGILDPTFGDAGKVTTRFRGGADATAMASGSDDSIVVVGGSVPDVDKFEVARYEPDGALDTAFGGDGKVRTKVGKGETSA